MPRAVADKSYFRFTQGKITEASPLTFPENSMKDELNIDINFDGTIQRRLGVDYEDNYSLANTFAKQGGDEGVVCQTFLWEDIRNFNDATPVVVVRYGNKLSFFRAYAEPVSGSKIGSDLELYSNVISDEETLSFTSGKGYLFVAGSSFDPVYIEYDNVADEFVATDIVIKIRDLEGVEDGLEENERPSSLTGAHMYNLINQGWPYQNTNWKRRPQETDIQGVYGDSVRAFYGLSSENFSLGVSRYPSNSDVYFNYMEGSWMMGTLLTSNYPRAGSSPKGKVVIQAFEENRKDLAAQYSNKSGSVSPWLSGSFEEKSTSNRPRAVAFFQGHVLYAGVDDLDYNDKIYVSQSAVGEDRFGKCYSVNDPTAEIESSPLDTDGGVISVGGIDKILSLQPIGSQCLIIANNGVWALGSPDSQFSMSNIRLSRLSAAGAISANSVSYFESTVFFWSPDGIYAVNRDPQFDTLSVTNITENTIQRDYVAIPVEKKPFVTTLTDATDRKIYWLYNNDSSDVLTTRYNRALIMDTRTGSFYDHEFSTGEGYPFVAGGFIKPPVEEVEFNYNVLVGTDNVVEGTDNVILADTATTTIGGSSVIKFLTFVEDGGNWDYTFSEYKDRGFVDWYTYDSTGLDFSSYVETGYELLGDSMRDKQTTYVFAYFNRTEENFVDNGSGVVFDYPSSCRMFAKWDWTSTNTANRWSDPQQVYRFLRNYVPAVGAFDYSHDVIETKNKVRGKGKSVSLRFESEAGKDFQLLGWAINYTAESKP